MVHCGELDELEQSAIPTGNLKKAVKGLSRDLQETKDMFVAVLKLSNQKEL